MQSAAATSEIEEQAGQIHVFSAADQNAMVYLEVLYGLATEISLATEAIAGNRPAQFLESAHRQESLLPELEALCRALRNAQAELVPVHAPFKAMEIRRAEQSLWQLARKYSVLLQRSAQSVALLARLHNSYAEQYPKAGQPTRARMTWSCEG